MMFTTKFLVYYRMQAMPPPPVVPTAPTTADVIPDGTDGTPKPGPVPEGRQDVPSKEQAVVVEAVPPPAEAADNAVQQPAVPARAEPVHAGGTEDASSEIKTVPWRWEPPGYPWGSLWGEGCGGTRRATFKVPL